MTIVIIGAGNVGSAVRRVWAAAGHEVVFGVRDPKDSKYMVCSGQSEGACQDPGRQDRHVASSPLLETLRCVVPGRVALVR